MMSFLAQVAAALLEHLLGWILGQVPPEVWLPVLRWLGTG